MANVECKFVKEMELGYHSFVIVTWVADHIEEPFIDKYSALDAVKAEVIFEIRYPEPVYATLLKPFTVDYT